MSRAIAFLIVVLAALAGCSGMFYPNPRSEEPAGIFFETNERQGLGWYRHFTLAKIDGLPVSHMGSTSEDFAIRVQPGVRRMFFQVGYMNSTFGKLHRAYFAIELPVEAGKKYRVGGSVVEDNVKFNIVDLSSPDAPMLQLTAVGEVVHGDTTLMIPGGGFVKVPSRQ